MKHRRDWALICSFLLVIGGCGLAFLAMPKADFSPRERRALTTLPSIFQAGFDQKFERYVADHFPLREWLVGVNAYFGLFTGRDGLNGAYMGREGFLIAAPMARNGEGFEKNLAALEHFAGVTGLPARLIAPMSKGGAMEDWIVGPHEPYPDREYLARLPGLDGVEWVAVEGVEYYRTDHHWTSRGAYDAYRALMHAMGETPSEAAAYQIAAYPGFYGTTIARSGYFLSQSDEIELWQKDANAAAFHLDKLEGDDMYQVFLGGDQGVDVLPCPSAPDRTLLLLKDSFADALAPFLMEHYREIVLVDLRYARNVDLMELVETHEADEILFVYSLDSLVNETSLRQLALIEEKQ